MLYRLYRCTQFMVFWSRRTLLVRNLGCFTGLSSPWTRVFSSGGHYTFHSMLSHLSLFVVLDETETHLSNLFYSGSTVKELAGLNTLSNLSHSSTVTFSLPCTTRKWLWTLDRTLFKFGFHLWATFNGGCCFWTKRESNNVEEIRLLSAIMRVPKRMTHIHLWSGNASLSVVKIE